MKSTLQSIHKDWNVTKSSLSFSLLSRPPSASAFLTLSTLPLTTPSTFYPFSSCRSERICRTTTTVLFIPLLRQFGSRLNPESKLLGPLERRAKEQRWKENLVTVTEVPSVTTIIAALWPLPWESPSLYFFYSCSQLPTVSIFLNIFYTLIT